MSKISEQKYEEQAEALRLIGSIATAFDIATKHQGGKYNGAIGSAGRYIIDALAMKRGAFFRPVPFKYVELCESTGFSSSTIACGMKRLIEHGFVTISGSRIALMAMLSLPDKAIAAFEQRQERWGSDFGRLITHSEITNFLAVLDEPEFEYYKERDLLESQMYYAHIVEMGKTSDKEP
jgi:hypothetical protein